MPKKHVMYQAQLHKNLARVEFCRAFNPKVAEKLRQILEEHKAKGRGQ